MSEPAPLVAATGPGRLSPVLLLAAVFCGGIALGDWLDPPPAGARWLACLSLGVQGLLARHRRGRRLRTLLLALVLGLARSPGAPPPQLAVPTEPVSLSATVAEVPRVTRKAGAGGDEERRTWFRTGEPRLLVLVEGDASFLRPGHRVRLSGRLLPPRRVRNPGDRIGRDAPPFFHVAATQLVDVLGYAPVSAGSRRPLEGLVRILRERIHQITGRIYPPRSRGVILALLIGDRRFLEEDILKALQRSGTFHFLAISGLHAGLVLALFLRLPLPHRIATPARLATLVLFALTTGAAPPVVRAVLMLSLGVVAAEWNRSIRPLDSFAWTAILLLAVRPEWLREIGFQLSAVAVLSILTWGPRFETLLSRWTSPPGAGGATRRGSREAPAAAGLLRLLLPWLASSVAISLAVSFGTLPLMVHHFQRFHPLAPLWNLLVYPPVAVILVLGNLSILLGAIHPLLAAPLAGVNHAVIALLTALLRGAGATPGSCVFLPSPPLWAVLLALALLAAAPFLCPVLSTRRRRLLTTVVLLVSSVCGVAQCLGRGNPPLRTPERPRVWFLDVGSGDSHLILLDGGEAVLVDAGSSNAGRTLGARLARSVLHLGLRRLDALILTHKDADHVNAVEDLLEVIPAREIWVSPFFETFREGHHLLETLRARGEEVRIVSRGARIRGGGRGFLEVLYPPAEESLPLIEHSNETSLVLRLRHGEHAVLFPADIEEMGTARLLSLGDDLAAEILIYPHHGRPNRLIGELLEAVRPRWVVLSSADRVYAPAAARRLERGGYRVHATWRDAAGLGTLDPVRGWQIEAPLARPP